MDLVSDVDGLVVVVVVVGVARKSVNMDGRTPT
jgi:hypothetical protein